MLKPSILERAFQCPARPSSAADWARGTLPKGGPMSATLQTSHRRSDRPDRCPAGRISGPGQGSPGHAHQTAGKPRTHGRPGRAVVRHPARQSLPVWSAKRSTSSPRITASPQKGSARIPRRVTQQMVLNFLTGGAAINVLARFNQVEVKRRRRWRGDADLAGHVGLAQSKVRRGQAET